MILLYGMLIPFMGTVLGSAMVFFLRGKVTLNLSRVLNGFAAGVMVAASVWSLLLPAINIAEQQNIVAWFPAATGFLIGIAFLLVLDRVIPHLHFFSAKAEGRHSKLKKSVLLFLAVTLHNIPEGMTVGVVFAGILTNSTMISFAGAIVLALGIALQNFPEGAIVSMPLAEQGVSRPKAFLFGTLSGVVEPIAGLLVILCVSQVTAAMPYLLSFAAGAMIYVVVEELVPEAQDDHSDIGTIGFSFGFVLMMILDIALG